MSSPGRSAQESTGKQRTRCNLQNHPMQRDMDEDSRGTIISAEFSLI